MSKASPAAWLAVALFALSAVPAARGQASDPYVLGIEDQVAVSVWLHPELERTVAVQSNGTVVFPPLGQVPAAGLTTEELGARLADRLTTYLRQPTTVTVTVSRYLARSIYVTGAVTTPGRYGFEVLPEIRDVLNAAGGGLPTADLKRVQVVRKGREPVTVDVVNAQIAGATGDLPVLQPGDILVVPALAGGLGPAPGDAFAVLGAVRNPGIYQAGPGTNTWMALAQAGGLRPEGDLSKIRVVSMTPEGQQVALVNLKDVLHRGGTVAAAVRPGDIVFVPNTTASIAAKGWTALTQALALTRDLVNIVILADYLDKR